MSRNNLVWGARRGGRRSVNPALFLRRHEILQAASRLQAFACRFSDKH